MKSTLSNAQCESCRDSLCGKLSVNLSEMKSRMQSEGKSDNTITKYMRDAQKFIAFARKIRDGEQNIDDRELLEKYRSYLAGNFRISSANSMIAGANYYLKTCGLPDLRIRSIRVQKELFRDDDKELNKEDYGRILRQAAEEGNYRLMHIMQTLGCTGIRISELRFVTVEAIASGKAIVSLKGKTREVLLPGKLCRQLAGYAEDRKIESGSIFITRNGRAVDRSNVLHEMKALSDRAGVDRDKVFPHNFRHLFAVTYYQKEKDVCHLADVLGHSSIETTRIYTARRRSDMMRSIEMLGLI